MHIVPVSPVAVLGSRTVVPGAVVLAGSAVKLLPPPVRRAVVYLRTAHGRLVFVGVCGRAFVGVFVGVFVDVFGIIIISCDNNLNAIVLYYTLFIRINLIV